MKINPQSPWDRGQIAGFLNEATVPVRLAFCDADGHPRICSLWFIYAEGALWCASHQNAYLVKQLQDNSKVSFEVSTNDYPYKGVRGKAGAELIRQDAEPVLRSLIAKYLGGSNQPLAQWLLSRIDEEYAIKLTPSSVNAWDFSNRMSK